MSQMSLKLIVGLGNPDKHLLSTRHNVGFWLLDNLVEKLSKNLSYIKKFDSDICELEHNSHQIYLMKPLSYINNSGVPIKKYIKRQNCPMAKSNMTFSTQERLTMQMLI